MGDVVKLPKKVKAENIKIFVCGCGCQTFFAYSTGEMVCTDCEFIFLGVEVKLIEGAVIADESTP